MATSQLKAGAILSYVILALSNLIALVFTPYMLRVLGQNEYGLYSLVASVVAYLTVLDFGFGNAIVRYTAKFRAEGKHEEQSSMFGMFLILYIIIGLISFILGLILYFNVEALFSHSMTINEISEAKVMIMLMVINVAVTFPLSIYGSIITAYEDFVFQRVIIIARLILSTLTMVLILELGYRAIGLVVVTTVFNISTLIINAFYAIKKLKIKIVFKKIEWYFVKEVGIYSFYIFLNIIMDKIYWNTGQFVLGAFVGTVAVAVFAIAINIQNMYMSFSTAISSVFLPHITAINNNQNSEKDISDLFIRTGRIQFVILAYILTGFIVFGKSFVILWAGNKYVESYYIALILLVPSTVALIQNLGIVILQARNQMKFRSILYIIVSLFSLAIQIPLSRAFGGYGAAFGVFLGLLFGQIIGMNIYYSKKQNIDIKKFWEEILKMSISPAVLGLIAFYVFKQVNGNSILDLTLGILIFSIIYIPVNWIFSINKSEKKLILSLLRIR